MLKLRQHFIPVVSEFLVPCFEDRYFHSIRRVVEDKDAAFRQRFLGLPAKRRPFSSQQYFEGEKTWKLQMILLWESVIWCDMWILDRFQPDRWQAMPTYARGYSNYVCCINIGQASQSIWASFALKTTHTQKKKKNNHQWILKVNLFWFWKNTS